MRDSNSIVGRLGIAIRRLDAAEHRQRPAEAPLSTRTRRTLGLAFIVSIVAAGCSEKSPAPTPPAAPQAPSTEAAAANKAATKEHGSFYGAKKTEYPDWFKVSFLDLDDDIAEAKAEGKRLMLIFHQDGCPYCRQLVERNLTQKDIEAQLKEQFDIVALNMWGDREVTAIGGNATTEKELAKELKVQFTPTVLFFDEEGKIVLRMNGYKPPQRFKLAIDYVGQRKEASMTYRQYVEATEPPKASGELHAEDFFSPPPHDLAIKADAKAGPLAVFFEQKDCPNCTILHTEVLPDEETRKVIATMKTIQVDMWSDDAIVTPSGKSTTTREWAKELNITYAPSIVFFDETGTEVFRTEAFFKVFHVQGAFRYVSSGAYKDEPSFQRYLSERAKALNEGGQDVDIWRSAGETPGQQP